MPGVLAADVNGEMHLFIESKAMCAEGNVFAGELAASMCVCWRKIPKTRTGWQEPVAFSVQLNRILVTKNSIMRPENTVGVTLLKTNLPQCFYLKASSGTVACQLLARASAP